MQQRRHLLTIGSLGVLCFVAGLWTGCTVDDSWITDPDAGSFPCESEDDCIQGFFCVEGTCQKDDGKEPPPCVQDGNPKDDIDLDNDGYGTGQDRTQCPPDKPQEDCNDSNADVHPGAAELCDGEDNDCDGEADEFDCEISTDCGAPPTDLAGSLSYFCIDGSCVMRPPQRPVGSDCEKIRVTCDSSAQAFTYELDGQTYNAEDVPEACYL